VSRYDAIVVGSGPNGLAAAIVLARAGLTVLVREGGAAIGGGARSAELTLPGFVHDVCSAIHPMAAVSPFFSSLPLAEHGLQWIHSSVLLAHPFENAPPALLRRSVEETARTLSVDERAYLRLMDPLVRRWDSLIPQILSPPLRNPSAVVSMTGFGMRALLSSKALTRTVFRGSRARAFFSGHAAHSVVALEKAGTSAIGLVMAAAGHARGWPIPRNGSQRIADSLASYFRSLGGTIETNAPVQNLDDLPAASAVLLDTAPAQVVRIAGTRLPPRYVRTLRRFSYGPGVFKIDWALAAPVPWKDAECASAATLHLGASAEEIEASERGAWNGVHTDSPFVLLAQPSLFDATRAPRGQHTAWAYCHVPNGSTRDMTNAIEKQIERFAPGFRDTIVARHTKNTAQLQQMNPNLIGGDIAGGANNLRQLLFRPGYSWDPYRMPAKGLYLCSASTPPGGGVHGMCGYHAARSALRHTFGRTMTP
jgi:phytoene dehydrogenase-like protein